jgi:peptidoglycan/xylan/chitin deacetylase (PgdA/CDA1 family)
MRKLFWLAICFGLLGQSNVWAQSVIRINQLGYTPSGIKIAVFGSKTGARPSSFQLIDEATGQAVFTASTGKDFGIYGPFSTTYRLNFTAFTGQGRYWLKAGDAVSPVFTIGYEVYKGAADFCLRYMRQQRSGFNPSLADSCHTHDGYTLYGPLPDSTRIDVSGGWHDASDYLQYVTTSANATYQLLAAWRDFPEAFSDQYQSNGMPGINGLPDVADEARWGLEWLAKMHPAKDAMYHQIADDRDHISMRRPGLDSQYGRGYERPVYFVTGKPQGSARWQNRSTGGANIAGKFAAAFALGTHLFGQKDKLLANRLQERAFNAYQWGQNMPGVCQTAPHNAPYFYEEENWADDMQLAASQLLRLTGRQTYADDALGYAKLEPITPWMGKDTARHYQYYPFANAGHYEMALQLNHKNPNRNKFITMMAEGLRLVEQKAAANAFRRGVPFIWCSNNLTVAVANQCHWYKIVTGDTLFDALEQANFDWLLGCNPWGTSMVYGLPAHGDTPEDPHSWFTHSGAIPIDGGLVDGPVYTSIFKNLIGITLTKPDAYAQWQSDLAVYHDDYGDYSTNEPTMDGTASLIYLLAAKEVEALRCTPTAMQRYRGAVIRGDSSQKRIALVFTGHEFGEGLKPIAQSLQRAGVKASFFVTGTFARQHITQLKQLRSRGHYIGPHSYAHLLYAPWHNRDSLLVTRQQFTYDLLQNYEALRPIGIDTLNSPVFLPPYEWYNDSIAQWTHDLGLLLISNTPGTLSAADYTTPAMPNYRHADTIYQSIMRKALQMPYGLNGYFLLLHTGAGPQRPDAFYRTLPLLLQELKSMGYTFVRADEMLGIKAERLPKPPTIKKPAGRAKKRHK